MLRKMAAYLDEYKCDRGQTHALNDHFPSPLLPMGTFCPQTKKSKVVVRSSPRRNHPRSVRRHLPPLTQVDFPNLRPAHGYRKAADEGSYFLRVECRDNVWAPIHGTIRFGRITLPFMNNHQVLPSRIAQQHGAQGIFVL